MKKFSLLFKGGFPSSEKAEEYMREWAEWIKSQESVLKEGYSFAPHGKMITGQQRLVSDFPQTETGVTGYAIIEVDSIEEAIEIAKSTPNLSEGGAVEIRPILEMPA